MAFSDINIEILNTDIEKMRGTGLNYPLILSICSAISYLAKRKYGSKKEGFGKEFKRFLSDYMYPNYPLVCEQMYTFVRCGLSHSGCLEGVQVSHLKEDENLHFHQNNKVLLLHSGKFIDEYLVAFSRFQKENDPKDLQPFSPGSSSSGWGLPESSVPQNGTIGVPVK